MGPSRSCTCHLVRKLLFFAGRRIWHRADVCAQLEVILTMSLLHHVPGARARLRAECDRDNVEFRGLKGVSTHQNDPTTPKELFIKWSGGATSRRWRPGVRCEPAFVRSGHVDRICGSLDVSSALTTQKLLRQAKIPQNAAQSQGT